METNMETNVETLPEPTKLFNKDAVILWQGQFVSLLGTHIAGIALMLWMKHTTGMATLMGLSSMLFSLSTLILTPIGGIIADLYSRKHIIVFCDLLAGVFTLCLGLFMFFYPGNIPIIVGLIFFSRFISGMLASFFGPAVAAAFPDIIPKDKLETANSLKEMTIHVGELFGQGLAGLLLKLLGAPLLMIFDGISYLISAFAESFMTIPQKKILDTEQMNSRGWKAKMSFFVDNVKKGIAYIMREQGTKRIIYLFTAMNFFGTPFFVLIPFLIEDYVGFGPEWYGYIMAFSGLGAFLGFSLIGAFNISKKHRPTFVIVVLILLAVISGLIGFIRQISVGMLAAFTLGMLNAFFRVICMTAVQHKTPSEIRGRVFGAMETMSELLTPLGIGLSGIIGDLTNKNLPLIFLGAGVLQFLSIVSIFAKKEAREILAYD